MIRCTHCGWLIEYRGNAGAWVHSDGRYFCWDTEDYKDPDYAIPNEAIEGVYLDGIVSIPTGDAVADAVYNMERASRDYTHPIRYTIGEPE